MDLVNVNQQTLDQIKKIFEGGGTPYSIRKDITTGTGLVAYNLEPAAKLLQPVITPLRNRIPRVANTRGGTAANWKVINSLDTSRNDPFTAEGTKASTISYTVADKTGAYKTISKGDNVSFQAQWAGKTFEDVKARSVARLLNNVLILEEQAILGGRNAALGSVTNPTVACDNTGDIADDTYNVIVRAVTNLGRGKKSTATSTGALSTSDQNRITATTPWVEGAVRYEWYVGTSGNEVLEATTSINSVSLTALAGTGAAVPADNSADTLAFDGLIAQITDANGAIVTTLDTGTYGVGTALSLDTLDAHLQRMWDTWKANPDVMYVNSQQSLQITNLVLAANGAPTLYVTNGADKSAITGGYRVTSYLNKTTGKPIDIVTHPYLNAGTILVGTYEMPFAASDIDNPIEVETRQEYMQLEYPIVAPKWEFEVLVDELLKLMFIGGWSAIRNIPN